MICTREINSLTVEFDESNQRDNKKGVRLTAINLTPFLFVQASLKSSTYINSCTSASNSFSLILMSISVNGNSA